MNYNKDFFKQAHQLIEAGRFIDSKNWVPATSGNFSAKLADGTVAITVSGKHKGRLTLDDIMLVDSDGNSLDGKKPSAETLLHTALYKRFPKVQSVLHPHTLNATLISSIFKTHVLLENYELLKALSGISTHKATVVVPIFPNDQNIAHLSELVDSYLDSHDDIYAYIIQRHGFYTWGASIEETLRHLEALEFLFECEVRLQGV